MIPAPVGVFGANAREFLRSIYPVRTPKYFASRGPIGSTGRHPHSRNDLDLRFLDFDLNCIVSLRRTSDGSRSCRGILRTPVKATHSITGKKSPVTGDLTFNHHLSVRIPQRSRFPSRYVLQLSGGLFFSYALYRASYSSPNRNHLPVCLPRIAC